MDVFSLTGTSVGTNGATGAIGFVTALEDEGSAAPAVVRLLPAVENLGNLPPTCTDLIATLRIMVTLTSNVKKYAFV